MRFVSKTKQFQVGDRVYARFFGDQVLVIEAVASVASPFPHYVCSLSGSFFLISKLWLSSKKLSTETEDSNYRQLSFLNQQDEAIDQQPVAV